MSELSGAAWHPRYRERVARWPVWTWLNDRPQRTDIVLAGAALVVGVSGLIFGSVPQKGHFRSLDPGAIALLLAMVVPLAWRRVRPDLVLAVTGTAEFLNVVAGYRPGLGWLAVPLAVYSLAAGRRHRSEVWPLMLWVGEVALLAEVAPAPNDPWNLAGVLGVTAAVWVRGDWTWSRRREESRDREARARQAVADERARIARELHDVVAHALGVIVMQAGGAGTIAHLEDADAKRVLDVIERTGRQAFAEMRRLVDVLRDDSEALGLDPQPSVAQLGALVQDVSAAGLPVTLEVYGQPRDVHTGVEVSAYRIVQEALTNSLKHAGGRAKVRIEWAADALTVEVTDDGSGGPRPNGAPVSRADTGGHGLVGMRERVALYGGVLEAAALPGGGFQVTARLPLVGGR